MATDGKKLVIALAVLAGLGGLFSQTKQGKRVKFLVLLGAMVFYAASRVFFSRLFNGPKRPTWKFGFEVLMTILNEQTQAASSKIELENIIQVRKAMGDKPVMACPPGMDYTPVTIPNSSITAEWIYPTQDKTKSTNDFLLNHTGPVMFYIHGGAYIGMSAATHRPWVGRIAIAAQIPILSINYRLAPEFPFPNGLLDCLEAYKWLTSSPASGGLGFNPTSIVVGGDSAGGGMTCALVATILNAKKDPQYMPLNYPHTSASTTPIQRDEIENLAPPALLVLLSPWLDVACQNPTWTENAPYCYLGSSGEKIGAWYAGHHQNEEKLSLQHPLVSPVHANFSGFPPILVQYGSAESVAGDSRVLCQQAKAGGVEVVEDEYEDMCHVFHMFGRLVPTEAKRALAKIVSEIKRVIVQHPKL